MKISKEILLAFKNIHNIDECLHNVIVDSVTMMEGYVSVGRLNLELAKFQDYYDIDKYLKELIEL